VLTISPLKHPYRTHQRPAATRTVTGPLRIHMPRIETIWAVIAVVSTAGQFAYKLMAVTTTKTLHGRMPMAALRMSFGRFVGSQAEVARVAAMALPVRYSRFIRELIIVPMC